MLFLDSISAMVGRHSVGFVMSACHSVIVCRKFVNNQNTIVRFTVIMSGL